MKAFSNKGYNISLIADSRAWVAPEMLPFPNYSLRAPWCLEILGDESKQKNSKQPSWPNVTAHGFLVLFKIASFK